MPANTLRSEGPQILIVPNHEPIPDAANLLVTFQDDPFVFQVWEVRSTPQVAVAHNNPRPALKHGGIFRYPDAEAYNNLGVALAQTGKIEEAIARFEQALRINPDFADAHTNLGNALRLAGRIPEAIEHFEQVVRIEPDLAEAYNNLGAALAQTGKIEEAIDRFEQALRINPDFADAHFYLGLALEKMGRTPEAIEHYEQALKFRPNFTPAKSALARLQSSQ
jgi:tetratricopeptide (TPR) repeat protein